MSERGVATWIVKTPDGNETLFWTENEARSYAKSYEDIGEKVEVKTMGNASHSDGHWYTR